MFWAEGELFLTTNNNQITVCQQSTYTMSRSKVVMLLSQYLLSRQVFGLVHFDNLFLFNAHQNSHEYMGIQVSEVLD